MVRKRHESRSAPKYRADPITQLVAERGLKAILKQLIEECGHESFQSAIDGMEVDESTPPRKPGRPDTINTDMHLADWIYSVAEDYREKKKPNPVELAEIDLYDLTLDE